MEPNPQLNWLSLVTILLAGVITINFLRSLLKKITGAATSQGLKPLIVAGGWPLIGHLPLLRGPEPPHTKLTALADKYGSIFSIQLGIHQAVVINTWEAAKQCFTTHDLAISSRPKLVAAKILGYNYAMFGFGPYGSYWREMRKTTNLQLLSNRRLELLRNARESEVNQALKELYQIWKERRDDGQGHASVEMKQWVGDLTSNLILGVVVGKRCFGAAAMMVDEAKARAWQKAMKELLRLMAHFTLGDVVPYLGWLDVGGHVRAMKRTSKELDDVLTQWLEEHKKDRASGKPKEYKDFMDVMLLTIKETTDALSDTTYSYDVDTIIKATCLSMVLGGSETTMVTVIWALSLLLNNRPALIKVQEELDTHIGRDRKLKESDISELVYLQAIVKETMRLYGATDIILRETLEDFTIDEFRIEKGTWLFINLWKIHRDGRVWEEPLEFKPERFLTTHKDFDVKGKQFELIPFGGGRRACPGISFALQVVSLILGGLLHAFDISTLEDAIVDMTETIGVPNTKATPLEVFIKPRLPLALYD